MKITCESCSAQYDLDESRIPASGISMKCPACLHQFTVRKPGPGAAAAPPPPAKKEIALSDVDEERDETPLPDDAPGMVAPKRASGPPPIPPVRPAAPLVPPRIASTPIAMSDEMDLPAPKMKGPGLGHVSRPPPMPIEGETTRDDASLKISAPAGRAQEVDLSEDVIDLPGPVAERPEVIDLPAPKGHSSVQPMPRADEGPDLLAPKRASGRTVQPIGLDLDAPDPEDMGVRPMVRPSAGSPPPGPPQLGELGDDGPPGLDLDSIDVVAPKGPSNASPHLSSSNGSEIDLPAPKQETMEVAPRRETMDVAPKMMQSAGDHSLDDPTPVEAIKFEPKKAAADAAAAKAVAKAKARAPDEEDDEKPRRRLPRALIAAAVVLILVGGVGVGLGMFTGQGYFGANLWNGKRALNDARMNTARKLMADDTLASYKKVAIDLRLITEADTGNVEVAALEAQARLCEARLGVTAEGKAAEPLLKRADDGRKEQVTPEVEKARALKLLVAGKPADARAKISSVVQGAPSDAVALQYLGWIELQAGDYAAADAAFGKALAAEPGRAAAIYGAGLCKEREGNLAAAEELYGRALARSPNHFGAAVGQARVATQKGAGTTSAQAKIEELIQKRSSTVGPKELADAWTSVGMMAAAAGRRDEAEDRLKRALALSPESTAVQVALARVRCDAHKCAESVLPLQKILQIEPKNLDARLALVRALVEGGQPDESVAMIAAAAAQAPKDARVLYWQGRVGLVAGDHDREKALQRFKDAIGADSKYIAAYLAESNAYAQLGKPDDALDALKQAEAKASDDPALMVELGQAYLGLGKAADAEARFRAALDKRPDFSAARIELGAALEAEDKAADAQKEYEAIAKKEPEYPGLAEKQARLQAKLGNREQAMELYTQALKQGVPTATLRLATAQLALDMDKAEQARQLAEWVTREDDRSAVAHLMVAKAQLALGHIEDALVEARRAAAFADLPEAHLIVGRALELLGKLDQSVTEYGMARKPPVEGEASLGRARILVRMGATRDALAELAALAKDPKLRAQALLLEADSYADLSQRDKARAAYEAAVKAGPESSEAAFKLGRLYLDSGKRKPAADMLERALKLAGDKAAFAAEAYLLLGDAHRESKENDAAIRAYKRYLELAPADAPQRVEVTRHLSMLGAP